MASPTATELALPGLEGGAVMSDPSPQHYIVRGPEKRLMVFSGRSHSELAAAIAEKLGVELGDVQLSTFPNDETYCRYLESIRGADVFVVQTGCPPVDKNLMELVLMIQAAKLASAKRITAVIPWFPYSRQDRKAKPREPGSARGGHAPARRCRPGADHGPPRGPGSGLLHHPGRPHDGAPALRDALPRPRSHRRRRRRGRA